MKKIILFLSILILLFFTTITKNSTKEIEKKIYKQKENLRLLKHKYNMVLLDFNYLSSPKKLMEYQSIYFEDQLKEIDITELNKLNFTGDQIKLKKFKNLNNE
tara:strand:- start:83 stop:391 length:309 start_codon:yes stop_codon:yes gene_type:complete